MAESGESPPASVLPSPSIGRGAILNLLGQVLPAVAALVAIPIIQTRLGDAGLGVLALAWAVVGYFSIFDLGLSRALTQVVATRLAAGRVDGLPRLVWTAWLTLAGVGLIAAAGVAAGAAWLSGRFFGPADPVLASARAALWWVALATPFVAVASGMRGVLEGYQRFDLVNAVRAPMGVLTYLGPALCTLVSPSLAPALVVLAAARIGGTIGYFWACVRAAPTLGHPITWSPRSLGELAATGIWMTVANAAGSAMTYLDRFVVGALAPLAAVAYYTTPQELVGKLQILPAALTTAAFPAFSAFWVSDQRRVADLFQKTGYAILVAVFPVTFAIAVLSPEWLRVWIGESFALNAAGVVGWVAVGTLVNAVAAAPFALLQATGHARLTAVFQVVELPLYAVALWRLTVNYGIEGAAAAWALRIIVDGGLLFVAAGRIAPEAAFGRWTLLFWLIAATVTMPLASQADALIVRGALAFLVALVTSGIAVRFLKISFLTRLTP